MKTTKQYVFSPDISRDCHLVVQFSDTEVIYSIYYIPSNTIIESVSMDLPSADTQAILNVLHKHVRFNLTYSQINILDTNHFFTLVPNAFFQHPHKKSYLNFNIDLPESLYVKNRSLPFLDAQAVFGYSKEVKKISANLFPNVSVNHTIMGLLHGYITYNPKAQKQIFVHIEKHCFYVAFFKNATLEYANVFHYEYHEDVAYFILNIYQQRNLNSEEQVLLLSGNIEEESNLYLLLKNHIRHVRFLKPPTKVNFSEHLSANQILRCFHHVYWFSF